MIAVSSKVKAVVDTVKLIKNARKIRSNLNEGVKLCAVLKADAYGHGAAKIAEALRFEADCFAVALSEEGIYLRLSGIDKEILVLLPVFIDEIERSLVYDLTLTVADLDSLKMINETAEKLSKTACIHLKINSGMNRIGADLDNIGKMTEYLKTAKRVKVTGAFSHISNADNEEFTQRQIAYFYRAKKIISKSFDDVVYHILSSSSFIKYRQHQCGMVRIGLALYGYEEAIKMDVEPILCFTARVLGTRGIKKGDSLLYGNYHAEKDEIITLLRVGYADGKLRKGELKTENALCMDVCAIQGKVEVDNFTIPFDAKKIAEENGTIPYEVLVKSTLRCEVIYI